jgi:Flp pilus assembly protein TadD
MDAGQWRRGLLISFLLLLAILAIYWPVGGYDFVDFDEQLYVTENPTVQNGLTLHGLAWAFTADIAGNWHPLTWLSHMADCQFFGINPGAHHWTNVIFHIANTLLLFTILAGMTGSLERSGVVAALFAVHPLHVESVAWVAERKDVLSAFFWILALGAYAWYAKRPRPMRYLLVLLLFTCGLMSKAMVVTLPCVLLLLDFWPLGRVRWKAQHVAQVSKPAVSPISKSAGVCTSSNQTGFGGAAGFETRDTAGLETCATAFSPARLILEKLPFFVLVVLTSILTFLAQQKGGAVGSLEKFPISVRVANAAVAYVSYIGKMICPEDLAVLYPHPGMRPMWMVLGSILLLLFISMLAIALLRRRPYLLVGWLWFLGTLVPVIGLVQVGEQSMADRYTYLPLIGLFIMATWGIADVLIALPSLPKAIPSCATALLLILLALGSSFQLPHWENHISLFTHTVNVTTDNPKAQFILAQGLASKGFIQAAMPHYHEALRLNPQEDGIHNDLGLALVLAGKTSDATNHYAEAIRLNRRSREAHFNYGLALASLGDLDSAIAHYAACLEISPEHFGAHNWMGKALAAQGKLDLAVEHYSEALRLKPDYEEACYNLGVALAQQGKRTEALAALLKAVRLKPEHADARAQLANLRGEALRGAVISDQ